MTRSIPVDEVRPLGDRALLIGVEDAAAGRALVQELTLALATWVDEGDCEVVGGLATVMVVAHDVHLAEQIEATATATAAARRGAGRSEPSEAGVLITIPCVFDGPDLDEVAEHCGVARDAVVAQLTQQPLSVAMLGFAPGFAFLDGLPEALRTVPRRARPRTTVPPGSVALANGHAAIYPAPSPGGWHLVGRTNEEMFSAREPPYARLAAGDRVQFVAVDEGALPPGRSHPPALFERPTKSRHLFTVLTPGLRTVLQDRGRIGVASIGVPEAGPADPDSFALASRLVGNSAKRAALEITGQGPTLRVEGSGYVTVVGASPQVRLDGQAVVVGQVIPVRPGQELAIGAVRPGLRSYLAAAGGFVGPRFFGSAAADQLSGLGPDPLRAGDALYVETMIPPLADHLDHLVGTHDGHGVVHLRVTPGPHGEWFGPDALARLAETTWVVAPESNRVGLRVGVVGAPPALRAEEARGRELDSQGMVHGAVQVPPDGGPVILLSDHATHGGYPVVAVVITADLGRLGQSAPGDRVTLTVVDRATAWDERATQRRVFDRAVIGYYPLAVE